MAHREGYQRSQERLDGYLGTADIKLSQLTRFIDTQPVLQPNSQRVGILERKFRRSTIRDAEWENHLKAVVTPEGIERALQEKGLNTIEFRQRTDYPKLEFKEGELICLGGRSRVLAARKLPPWDRRWPVDLYHPGISLELRTQLRDNHVIQAPPSDGEIFLTLQQYKQAGDIDSMNQWGALLSDTKERNLSRIADREIGIILSSLCEIPALWQDGFFPGVIHKMRSLHVNSEIVHYLTEVRDSFGGHPAMAKLTARDVDALQGSAPGSIKTDRAVLEDLINKGELVESFSEEEKSFIYKQLESRKFMIPTVFTFFQDIRIINQCAPILLKLIDRNKLVPENGSREPDIKASMRYMFERESGVEFSDNFDIEVSESSSRTVIADSNLRFQLAYRQLWLYAIRHFLRPDHRRDRKIKFHIDEEGETENLAVFASKLRFSSDSITHLASKGPAQPRTRIILDRNSGVRYAEAIDKYGIPRPASWQWDRQLLYLDRIYSPPEDHEEGITTFFVLQSMFYNFFGYPEGFSHVDQIPMNHAPEPSDHRTEPANSPAEPAIDNTGPAGQTEPSISEGSVHIDQIPMDLSPNQTEPANTPAEPAINNTGPAIQTESSISENQAQAEPAVSDHARQPNFTGAQSHPESTESAQITVDKIDKLLNNLSQLQAEVERLKDDHESQQQEIPPILTLLSNLNDASSLNESQDLLHQTRILERSLQACEDSLNDSARACLGLISELHGIKQELLKPLSSEPVILDALISSNSLYAQSVDVISERVSYYQHQVHGIFEQLPRYNVTVMNVGVKCTILQIRQEIEKFQVHAEGAEQILNETQMSIGNDNEIGKLMEDMRNTWQIWRTELDKCNWTMSEFEKSPNLAVPLNKELCDSISRQREQLALKLLQFPPFINNTQAKIDELVKSALLLRLNKQYEYTRSLTENVPNIIDETTRTQTQQRLDAELSSTQSDKASLQSMAINSQECQVRIHEREVVLREMALVFKQSTEELGRRLSRVDAHVQLLLRNFPRESDEDFNNAYAESHKSAKENEENHQAKSKFDRARDNAIALETHLYREILSSLQKMSVKLDKLEGSKKAGELKQSCREAEQMATKKQNDVHTDIESDTSPGTLERESIEQLAKKYREILATVKKEFERIRSQDIRGASSGQRKSSRLRKKVQVKIWMILELGKCRPLLVDIKWEHIQYLGRNLIEDGFNIERLYKAGTSYLKSPINFAVSLSTLSITTNDFVGLLAYKGTIKWENKYGNYLRRADSFWHVTWDLSQSHPWQEASDKFDFDLKEKSEGVGQRDAETEQAKEERFRKEAKKAAAKKAHIAEEERVARERAFTLAQLEHDDPPDVAASSSASNVNLPSLIARLRGGSDGANEDDFSRTHHAESEHLFINESDEDLLIR